MGKSVIRCCGKLNDRPCSNILAYISADGKLTMIRHGRMVEIAAKENGGSVTITCEKCGQKNRIATETIWKVKKNS